jgi:hypothetical protein
VVTRFRSDPLKTFNAPLMKTLRFSIPVLALTLLHISTAQAAITWGEPIAVGTAIRASQINELRDAIQVLRTDVDAGSGGVWTSGAGGDVYYNAGDVG